MQRHMPLPRMNSTRQRTYVNCALHSGSHACRTAEEVSFRDRAVLALSHDLSRSASGTSVASDISHTQSMPSQRYRKLRSLNR